MTTVEAAPGTLATQRLPRWLVRYTAAVVASDLLAVAAGTAVYSLWGTTGLVELVSGAMLVSGLVVISMMVTKAWTPAVLGQGPTEFARLLSGMAGAAVIVVFASLALDLPQGRPWVFGVLPLATVLAAAGRKALRSGLHRRRAAGEAMRTVLAVGDVESVTALVERTRRARHEGLVVTAACVPDGVAAGRWQRVAGVPVVGDVDEAEHIAADGGYDIVSVGRVAGWTPGKLRSLAWGLEETSVDLVVDPGLMEIAGPRLHTASLDGLPLLQLTHPQFTGVARVLKTCLDRVGAVVLLLLLAPLLLDLAIAVALDGGPVLVRRRRVGLEGREFSMLKFRTHGAGGQTPTRIGAFLQRRSLDELPQLLNVLVGSMSLVGPRPPQAVEVAAFERAATRRLLVKPGMTGLWQVSGRTELSWEESVRLDLRYVENWSLALDMQILVRTVRAVFTR